MTAATSTLGRPRALEIGACLALAALVGACSPARACACSTAEQSHLSTQRSNLRNLITAREAYFAAHERYATVTDAGLYEGATLLWKLSRGVHVVPEGTASSEPGWSAHVAYAGLARRCSIVAGRGVPGPHAAEGQRKEEPFCDPPAPKGYVEEHGRTSFTIAFFAMLLAAFVRVRGTRRTVNLARMRLVVVPLARLCIALLIMPSCGYEFELPRELLLLAPAVVALALVWRMRPPAPTVA